jgi:hypothetical protein
MLLPITGESSDRRARPRCACHRPCIVRFDRRHLDGQPGTVGAEGAVIDLSACGVGLRLRSAILPGATLSVEPLNSETTPLPLACVVRCVHMGGYWQHGCSLERHLNEEELDVWWA